VHYIVTYANNVDIGTARATVTGAGGYSGTLLLNFQIVAAPKPVSGLVITALPDQTYTGSAFRPAPEVKDGSTTLVEGTHYTLTYANNVNVGTATVTVTGTGVYSGTKTVTFRIVAAPKPVSGLVVSAIPDQTHTGSAIQPTPEVKDGSTTLVKDTHYTLTYAGNVNVGTATVTVTGLGNYSGTKAVTFRIVAASVPASPPVAVYGRRLTPTGGTGTLFDPYVLAVTAPDTARTLLPSNITVTDDAGAVAVMYADSFFTQSMHSVDFNPGDTVTVYVKITSGGTDYYHSLRLASPKTVLPPVLYTVKVPAVAGFTTDPIAGTYPVSSGSDFTFRLTPASLIPSGMQLTVATNRLLLSDAAGLRVTPNQDSYTVVILRVQENTEIGISLVATGVDAIAPAQVWASGRTLYIHATQSGTAQVYRLTGQLVTALPFAAGETAQTTLPQGVYVVAANGKASKVIIEH
jgi:hypothetical protein